MFYSFDFLFILEFALIYMYTVFPGDSHQFIATGIFQANVFIFHVVACDPGQILVGHGSVFPEQSGIGAHNAELVSSNIPIR